MPFQTLPALQARGPNMHNAFAIAMQSKAQREAKEQQAALKGLRRNAFADPGNTEARNALAAEGDQFGIGFLNSLDDRQKAQAKQEATAASKALMIMKNAPPEQWGAINQSAGGLFKPEELQAMQANPSLIDLGIGKAMEIGDILSQQNTEIDRKIDGERDARDYGLNVEKFDETKRNNRFSNDIASQNAAVARANANRAAVTARQGKIPDGYRLDGDGALVPMGVAGGGRFEAPPNIKDEGAVRREFTQVTKPFAEADNALRRALASKDDAVGDIALIFAYMKMLDPGSVVREGEFATAEQAQGIDSRILNLYNKTVDGTRLTPQVRASMREQAMKLYEPALGKFQQQKARYESIADSYRMAPERIVYGAQPLPGQTSQTPQRAATPRNATPGDAMRFVQPGAPTVEQSALPYSPRAQSFMDKYGSKGNRQ